MINLLELNKAQEEYIKDILHGYELEMDILSDIEGLKVLLSILDNEVRNITNRKEILNHYIKNTNIDIYFKEACLYSKDIGKENIKKINQNAEDINYMYNFVWDFIYN